MAENFTNHSSWSLQCIKCHKQVVNASDVRLAQVGSDGGLHLALRPELEPRIDSVIEKRQHPRPERRKEAPFKMYCLNPGCPQDLGVYQVLEERFFYVFSSKSVRFGSRNGEVAKIKRWRESRAELERMGVQVMQVKALWQKISKEAADATAGPRNAKEMIYCDTTKTSNEQVNKLVLDTPREYQRELFRKAMGGNAIVYLPTGSGKTLVASMVINAMLKLNPGKMTAFLVHRIPLVYQQSQYLKKQNPRLRVEILAGDLTRFPGDRQHWVQVIESIAKKRIDVLVITAQIFYNFLKDDDATLKLSDVSCMVFDEAHNCRGNHVFAQIMRDFYDTLSDRYKPLVLGLTASPAGASTIEDTREQLTALLTTLRARCIMPTLSNDLALHWNNPVTSYKCKPLSSVQENLESILVNYIQSICPKIEQLSAMQEALSKTPASSINFKGCLRTVIDRCHSKEEYVQGLALAMHAMNMYSIVELNRVLGPKHAYEALDSFFQAVDNVRSPMDMLTKRLLQSEPSYQTFRNQLNSFSRCSNVASGRFTELLEIVRDFVDHVKRDNTGRAIIFVHMRRTCLKLREELNKDPVIKEKLKPLACVGHGNGLDGMQWKGEQEVVITRFHEGDCKLLVSTNVLEEGLDVPACNLVIRYDSRGTSLRALVQSRGRAARRADSKFVIMCNSEEEKQRYLDLAVKEANIERAVREKIATNSATSQASRFGCKQHAIGPEVKEGEKRKAPEEQGTTSKKQRIQRSRPKTCAVFTLHVGPSEEVSEAEDFLKKYFDITSFKPESATGKEEKRIELLNRMLRTNLDIKELSDPGQEDANKKQKSRDELSQEIVKKWCEHGPRNMWLERRGQPRNRGVNVHPLFLTAIGVGDFQDRATFSEEWSHVSHPGGMAIFEHDLKNVTVAFQNREEGSIFKLEFPYKEMHDYILVDTARPGVGKCTVFIPLRNVPRILEAEGFYNNEADADEDSRLFELLEQGEMLSDSEDDWSMDSDSDNEMDQDESTANAANGNESASEPGTEIIGKLKQVTKWKRLNQIPIGRHGYQVGVFGNSLVLKIVLLFNENLWDMLRTLGYYERRICFSGIQIKPKSRVDFGADVQSLDPTVQYALQCLTSRHPAVRQRISGSFFRELKQNDAKKCVDGLSRIAVLLDENYFVDPETTLLHLLQNLQSLGRRKLVVPENCVLIPRMIFTPTREIFFPHEVMEKNRVLRDFHQLDFLCLQIRDEDLSRLAGHAGKIGEILTRLKQLLKDGVKVGGKYYQFLGCSNSQLRSHSCWFVSPTAQHTPDTIRQWMGDFSHIRCVATLMARMGQCFSTSTDTIAVVPEETGIEFKDIDDVEITAADQTYTFSDGVGRISSNVAKKASILINKKLPPSAFQIRFAGYKGVLTTDPQIPDNQIQLRPSMRKFQSEHRRLEVLQTSRPQAVYLNHQLIMLLSNLGVPDQVFLRHQEKMLDALAYMMTDENEAKQRLSCAIRTGINYKELSDVGVCLTTEPYFRSLLCALYRQKIHGLLSKARILLPVTEARLMMGVMDETGFLQSGQVFVQYTEMRGEGDENFGGNTRTVVAGKVVVTRNPCLHPGDVRQLEAVNIPELRHLVDCVVFPSKGARPHPNEMAGGDLDGDLYFVSWSEDMLPRQPDFAPMNYKAPKKKEESGTINLDHMTEFISEYIKCDQLGIIDNTHKAQADTQGKGVESEVCLRLAELHSLAVDAPKTGLWQEVPVNARLREYPDFMMKTDKPSYPSQKILGKLYRECKNFQQSMNFRPPRRTGHVDPRFLAQGFEEYVESARETLAEYTEHIENVLNLYGIQTEEELTSGCFYKLQKKLGRERQQIADVVRRLMSELRATFRRSFFLEFSHDNTPLMKFEITEEMQKKASAWYYVAYQSEQQTTPNSEEQSKRFVGFPWIVDDVLVTIPLANKRPQIQGILEKNAYSAIEDSLGKFFAKQAEKLLENYEHRLQVKSFIQNAVKENSRVNGVVMFGSSATFFFEDMSDIDLCALPSNMSDCLVSRDALKLTGNISHPDQKTLLRKLEPLLRKVYNGVHFVAAKVPIFRLAGLKGTEFGSKLCADLCANPDGFLKGMVVSWYIHKYPPLLPLLRMLIQWARDSGLTSKREGCLINTNVLVFMLLSFCVRAGWVAEPTVDEIREDVENIIRNKTKDENLVSKWKETFALLLGSTTYGASAHDNGEMEDAEEIQQYHFKLGPRNTPLGYVLLEFFHRHQSLLDSDIPEAFVELLDADQFKSLLGEGDAELLHDQMQRAYHILALHCDVTVLLEVSSAKDQISCHLTDQLSAWIAGSEGHHSKLFSEKSGAKVRIRPRLPGLGTNLLLEATGTSVALRVLENILDDKSASLIAQPFSCLGMCFVSDANVMIFEGSESDNDPVNLVPYYGRHHSHHDYLVRHVPLLGNAVTTSITDPKERSFRIFLDKLQRQLEVVERDYTPIVHGGILEFNVHFGRLYTFHVPRSMTEDTEPMTVKTIQISLKKGFESKAACLMSLQQTSSTKKLFRLKPRRQKKQKQSETKKEEEKTGRKNEKRSPKHSFFTNIPEECIAKIIAYLERRGFVEDPKLGSPYLLVTVNADDGRECDVTYDSDIRPMHIRSPKLRWFVVDVKRPWEARSVVTDEQFNPNMLNGSECDLRLMIRSYENFSPSAVHNLPQKKFLDILKPKAESQLARSPQPAKSPERAKSPQPASSSYPFLINLEFKNNMALIRHHVEQRVFTHRSDSTSTNNDFLATTTVSFDEVVEYSRLKVNGRFDSVFTRHEMTIMPKIPVNWTSRNVLERFAWNIWTLANEIARQAYQ